MTEPSFRDEPEPPQICAACGAPNTDTATVCAECQQPLRSGVASKPFTQGSNAQYVGVALAVVVVSFLVGLLCASLNENLAALAFMALPVPILGATFVLARYGILFDRSPLLSTLVSLALMGLTWVAMSIALVAVCSSYHPMRFGGP